MNIVTTGMIGFAATTLVPASPVATAAPSPAPSPLPSGPALNRNFYTHEIGGQRADFYRICREYKISDQAIGHALKKLLRCGRSHKSIHQDVQDCIDSLKRWQEMNREDEARVTVTQSSSGEAARA